MDNASKALLIAGEILISILVIGLIATAISKFGGFSENINKKLNKNKEEDFNNNFFKYESKIDTSAEEIASLANYAKEYNDSYELFLKNGGKSNEESPYFVEVVAWGMLSKDGDPGYIEFNRLPSDNKYKETIRKFLENNNQYLYRCKYKPTDMKISETECSIKRVLDSSSSENIKTETKDNGRKGYVKKIVFNYCKFEREIQAADIKTIEENYDLKIMDDVDKRYLTKVNRDIFTIE